MARMRLQLLTGVLDEPLQPSSEQQYTFVPHDSPETVINVFIVLEKNANIGLEIFHRQGR